MKRYFGIVTLIIFVLFIFVAFFYWLQLRPAQIKHDCSWTRAYVGGESAHPAMTEAELRSIGLLKNCELLPKIINNSGSASEAFHDSVFEKRRMEVISGACEAENTKLISSYSKPRAAIPAKEQQRKTTDQEYKFCLRDKGL